MYDSNTHAALATGQLVLRDFLTVFGKDSEGDPAEFCFWTGEDDVTTNVVAIDGSTDSRDFVGGGSLPESGVPEIIDQLGLEARTIEIALNQLHPDVQDMARAGNVTLAALELHRGVFSPATWTLVSTPFLRFYGRVDGLGIDTPAVGGEGAIVLRAVSDLIYLTYTNPAMKSDEQQRLRSGDRARRYSDTAGDIEVRWGLAKGAA